MIELQNISKTYNEVRALQSISFSVDEGEVIGIVGKSGSGKSTLLRLLNLMEEPSSGKLLVDGRDSKTFTGKERRQHKQQIGMVFQNYNLLDNLRVYENVALPLKLQKRKNTDKIENLLEFVDIGHKASSYPTTLSGGEKQRVSIARALSREPRILLCDEATSSLDEENTESVIRLLKKTHDAFHPTIFFVSHELETVKSLCQRIFVMEHGRLIGELSNEPQFDEEENLTYFDKIKRGLEH